MLSAWLISLILLLPAGEPAGGQPADLKKLVERIATADKDEAREAEDELIEKLVGPLADAIGALESRPPAEQVRVRAALGRVTAALRVRLFRADLEEKERKLLDRFQQKDPDLVLALFQDDPERRIAALEKIPLEPNSAAGVLIVGKVNDWDGDVAEAALELAGKLKDEIVVRGLTRYIEGVTRAVRDGELGDAREYVGVVLAVFTSRSIQVLGEAGAKESVPAILDALQFFGKSRYRQDEIFEVGDVAEALGKIGDERAADALVQWLHESNLRRVLTPEPGKSVSQTEGDVVLMALAKIYGLSPKELGFYTTPEPEPLVGFLDDAARQEAVRRFLAWHKENAGKPKAQRGPATSQPGKP